MHVSPLGALPSSSGRRDGIETSISGLLVPRWNTLTLIYVQQKKEQRFSAPEVSTSDQMPKTLS